MFDEMIAQMLIAEGYTREMSGDELASVVAESLADRQARGADRVVDDESDRDNIFRLDDFDRGRHAARVLFVSVAFDLDMDDGHLPELVDVLDLDDDGWKVLIAAIAADTFEGSTLEDLRELGMVEGDVVEVHFSAIQLNRMRDSLRVDGWRVAVGTRRGFEKWTPTGDAQLGGEAVVIRDDGAVYWIARDEDAYVNPHKISDGVEDIRFAGSPAFTRSFRLKS